MPPAKVLSRHAVLSWRAKSRDRHARSMLSRSVCLHSMRFEGRDIAQNRTIKARLTKAGDRPIRHLSHSALERNPFRHREGGCLEGTQGAISSGSG
jgi:hypothetical protein